MTDVHVNALCERLRWTERNYWEMAQESRDSDPVKENARQFVMTSLGGRVIGLRESLCIQLGYDVVTESDREGLADQFFMQWQEDRYPDEEM